MATQTRSRVFERPLNVVLRPRSPAEAAYRSAVLAPGFERQPGLDLRYLGGRTIARLTFTNVYLGSWDTGERDRLDHALSAAMADPHLNNVLAQYFEGTAVGSTFAGSRTHAGQVPARVYTRGGEIGDIPMSETGTDLSLVMKEVPLADGSGTVPIQLMWSNAVGGPEGPLPEPHRAAAAASPLRS